MFITIITALYKCDIFIDVFINNIISLQEFQKHSFIFTNIEDSNSSETNAKIKILESYKNIKILNKLQNTFKNIFDEWNIMAENVKTDLVCFHRYQEKLRNDFLVAYSQEFINNNKIDLLCSPLLVSKNLNDDFNSKNVKLIYNKKEIFVYEKDFKNFININKSIFDYQYKFFMMLNCINDKINIIKKIWCNYDNIDIFDFFKNNGTDFIDLNNLNLFNFPGRSLVCKIELFNKYGNFDYINYNSYCDTELWLRFFKNNFKMLNNSYIIYYNDEENIFYDERIKRSIIKKYHPIFNYINTKLDVIIPYRNRENELQLFLKNFRKTHDIYFEYNIILCEQDDNNDFCRGQLINTGVKYILEKDEMKKSKLFITDVDLLYKKIHVDIIKPLNYKLYGINNLQLSAGGGAFICSQKSFVNFNGFSNKYIGWGSEDLDITYRLYFSNNHLHNKNMIDRDTNDGYIIDEIQNKIIETENKNKYCDKNNTIFIQQVINYNLYFYSSNKSKFIFKENKIFYNDILFFEGKFVIFDLIEGKLYDLVSSNKQFPSYFIKKPNVLIYNGSFVDNKPNGYGIGYSLWNMINYNLVGYWENGFILKIMNLNEYNINKNNNILIPYIELNNDQSFLYGVKENNYIINIISNEKNLIHLKIKI
jgi:hypothetical protein